MTTSMHVLGWSADGLRCPDHEIDCCDSKGTPKPITLIQMPNGTGKTTTLTLLRAALSGAAAQDAWDRNAVRDFQKRDQTVSRGTFSLRLLLNEKLVTIIMEFDFENGTVRYRTTRGIGQVEGFDPPIEFRRFMNEEFVKFYVFDGELADNILDREHTDAEQAVESLFQIHLLGQMKQKVTEYWDYRTRDVSAKDQTGHTRRANTLRRWRKRLENLQRKKSAVEKKLEVVQSGMRRYRLKYKNEIEKEADRAKKISVATDVVEKLMDRVAQCAQSVLDSMRGPHAISEQFAENMFDLKQGLDRVKLPATAAREFFEELAEDEKCVCGREIDDVVSLAIRDRARQYLGTEDVSLLNHMKGSISDAVGQSRIEPGEHLSKDIELLAELMGKELVAKNELDELNQEAERSNPDVKQAKGNIDELEAQEKQLKRDLSRFVDDDDKVRLDRIGNVDLERIFSVETLAKGVRILEDQVDEIVGTLNLRTKRDLLIGIIESAHAKARENVIEEVKGDANRRISTLMPDNPISIEDIDRCVVLQGQSSGSAGENLSIGYAFLATLFNRAGEHQLPFIVDSPANPIDYDIRPKIGQLVPELTDQFIAFIISSERERFLPSLEKNSMEEIRYITLFRKGASRHEERAKKYSNCVVSRDGFKVMDKSFFGDFQLDTEEES